MKAIYVIPGIMGSRLSLGNEEIWPPSLSELTVSHYSRMAQLCDPATRATGLIDQVTHCYVVYGSLLDDLRSWGFKDTPNGGERGKLIPWPYDWRLDNRQTAQRLSSELTTAVAAGIDDITLLAHSMGGLIARYALEVTDPALGNVSWRQQCKRLVTLGTPHRGAPLALVRALGMESTMGMRAQDIRSFTADPRYPAAYQLLPPTQAFGFWNSAAEGVDLNDPRIVDQLKLNPQNLQAATQLYQALHTGQRPPNCRYFCFVGRKLETIVRGDLDPTGHLTAPKVEEGGDGTVPLWSGTLPDTQFQLDGDEHGRTFRDPALRLTLARLLGVPVSLVRGPEDAAPIVLKIPKPIFTAGEEARFRIESTLPIGTAIDVLLQPIDQNGQDTAAPIVLTNITSQTPSDAIIFSIVLPPQVGLYKAYAVSTTTNTTSEPQYLAVQKQ